MSVSADGSLLQTRKDIFVQRQVGKMCINIELIFPTISFPPSPCNVIKRYIYIELKLCPRLALQQREELHLVVDR